MDSVQNQITTLSTKIDVLHQAIEQINARVAEAISSQQIKPAGGESYASAEMAFVHSRFSTPRGFDAALEHKDILVDGLYSDSDSHSREQDLDPSIQIQRLTAQLTAAYNRIAALEEQLLARRVHQ